MLDVVVLWRAKLKAAALHALITAGIALLTAGVCFGVWYPGQLAEYFGGTGLFLLVLGVEICLGPLLSLVVYNPVKPRGELIRDYGFIGCIQLSALVFGLHSTYVARPVYIVFVTDRIELVSALELNTADIAAAKDMDYRTLPLFGPESICVRQPNDPAERSAIFLSSLRGKDIHLMPDYYRRCGRDEILSNAKRGATLVAELRERGLYDQFKADLPAGEFLWLPVHSRLGAWVVVYPNTDESLSYYLAVDFFSL